MRFRLCLLLSLAAACSSSSTPDAAPAPATEAAAADAAAPLPSLGLNDVSVLLPIPSSPASKGLLGPTTAGAKGALLPQAVYDKIPKFGVEPVEGLDYARMRAVGIRFDGCFPGPAGCEAQIRIVMQPISDQHETLDSAIHLFYRLTDEELPDLVIGLRQLRALAPEVKDAPLDIHAGLVAQGMTGEYGTALNELVLRYAGADSLRRMTFFLRSPSINEFWMLGGFNRTAAGAMTPLDIVGVGKGNQRVDRLDAAATSKGYSYQFTPEGNMPETLTPLMSSEVAKTSSADDRLRTLAAVARLENPKKYGPDQLPCAGCHVSTVVAAFTKRDHGLDMTSLPDAFTSTHDLTLRGESATTPSSLRAFGYFGKVPMISQRVVNETAAVVDDLEKRFPKP
ncbi:MAG: hypothetical protein JWP87_6418 [Labilithrix sp.]|nr:hypothetical protein [Labilithrix sp.]